MFRIPLLHWRSMAQTAPGSGRRDARPGIALRFVTGLLAGTMLWEPGFFD